MLGGAGIAGFIFDGAKEEGMANNLSLGACPVPHLIREGKSISTSPSPPPSSSPFLSLS
jgi:hypothetical protein